MKRMVLGVGSMSLIAVSPLVFAGSDPNGAATQPATRPVFDGKVLSMSKPSMPATMPSAKPPEFAPAFGAGDAGGDHSTGVILHGGIGATVVPSNGGGLPPATQPVGR